MSTVHPVQRSSNGDVLEFLCVRRLLSQIEDCAMNKKGYVENKYKIE